MPTVEKTRESEETKSTFISSSETSSAVDEREVDGALMNHIQQRRRNTLCLRDFAPSYVGCMCLMFIFSAILYCYLFAAIPTTKRLIAQRMDVDDDSESIRYAASPSLKHRIFHLDLKGAAPRVEFYSDLFPMLYRLNFTDILMEYEDMFPYHGSLSVLKRRTAYTEAQVKHIQQLASVNNLHIVPLVQTFGHMEFALKYPEFQALREVSMLDDTICPSDTKSIALIREMLTQVRKLHPQSTIIHIGADEAWHIAQDQRCVDRLRRELGNSTSRLKLSHIATVARIAKEELAIGKVWAWNDMFDDTPIHQMNEFELGRLLVPVVWGYVNDVLRTGYFPDGLFYRLSAVFDEIILAGAFKGANGVSKTFLDTQRYLQNLHSYYRLYSKYQNYLVGKVSGVALTGWQRYSHWKPLCELLPIGLPCAVKQAFYLTQWDNEEWGMDLREPSFLRFLNCSLNNEEIDDKLQPIYNGNFTFVPPPEVLFRYCQFPGSDVYEIVEDLRLIRWKSRVNPEQAITLKTDMVLLREKARPILQRLFYNDTVDEWLAKNMDPDSLVSNVDQVPSLDGVPPAITWG